ncbi:MAG: ABC transporter permease [Chloroflexota bacterium]
MKRARPERAGSDLPLFAFLGLVMIFMLAPIAIVVVDSFNSVAYGTWPPPSFSLRWYGRLFRQGGFGIAAVHSLEVGVVATAVALLVGTLASLALVRYRFPGRGAIHSFLLAPMIVPKVSLGLAAFILFLRLHIYGSLFSLMLGHVVITLPFVVTLVSAGLLRVNRTLEEAAMDLGASAWQAFLKATLPQIRRSLAVAAIFSFVISFDEVDASIFMVNPRNTTLPIAMYIYMQKYQDPTLAALSTILVGATLVLALVVLLGFGPSGLAQTVWSRGATGTR